jgi:hypothetical protein
MVCTTLLLVWAALAESYLLELHLIYSQNQYDPHNFNNTLLRLGTS